MLIINLAFKLSKPLVSPIGWHWRHLDWHFGWWALFCETYYCMYRGVSPVSE